MALALALALPGCGQGRGGLEVRWALVDGRGCADSGVAQVNTEVVRDGAVLEATSLGCLEGGPGAAQRFEALPEGVALVRVEALSAQGGLLYAGASLATICADEVTPVGLALAFKGGGR